MLIRWITLLKDFAGSLNNTMTMTMTMKISLFDINHLNTMIRENKTEKNNVVNEQETIQNNKMSISQANPLKH